MPKFLTPIDLNKNELQNAVMQNLATAPSTPVEGQKYYNSADHNEYTYNGTSWIPTTIVPVTTVTGTLPIVSSGGTTPAISINAATGSAAGSMSASDYAKLAAATNANTASTIVMRDASGNFVAGTMTGNVTGSAGTATGNAGSATKLITARTINGVSFDGTANITVTAAPTAHAATHKLGGADLIRLDELALPTASVNLNTQKIINLATPTLGTDAVTKDYADSLRSGISIKDPVRVASTATVVIATGTLLTIDGVVLVAGDRVLLKNQTAGAENGIYVAGTGAWTRSTDFDATAEVPAGTAVWVNEGTANGDSRWVLTTNSAITLGTTALVFTKDFQASDIVAGTGITKTGNQIDVVGTANRITANADSIDIASTYVGQTSIATLGTVATGTWQGTYVGVAYGGTGASDAATARTNLGIGTMGTQGAGAVAITGGTVTGITDLTVADGGTGSSTAVGARTNLGATGKYSIDVGNGALTSIDVVHGLNTLDVVVLVKDKLTPANVVMADMQIKDVNTVTLLFAVAPTASQYRCVVIG